MESAVAVATGQPEAEAAAAPATGAVDATRRLWAQSFTPEAAEPAAVARSRPPNFTHR